VGDPQEKVIEGQRFQGGEGTPGISSFALLGDERRKRQVQNVRLGTWVFRMVRRKKKGLRRD